LDRTKQAKGRQFDMPALGQNPTPWNGSCRIGQNHLVEGSHAKKIQFLSM